MGEDERMKERQRQRQKCMMLKRGAESDRCSEETERGRHPCMDTVKNREESAEIYNEREGEREREREREREKPKD